MRKHFITVLPFLIFLLLTSCVATPVEKVRPDQVSSSYQDTYSKKVPDSNIVTFFSTEEYYVFWIRPNKHWKKEHLTVAAERYNAKVMGTTEPLQDFSTIIFDLSSIPKDSFIISSGLGLYLVRTSEIYDEHIGHVMIRDGDTPIKSEVDLINGWYRIDLTDVISKKISSGDKTLELNIGVSAAGLRTDTIRRVRFASKRMGNHVAPILVVEYMAGK